MRVFHTEKLEVLFPIRSLFLQRWIAETGFHPGRDAGLVDPRPLHIVLIFVAGDGTLAESLPINGVEKRVLLFGSNASSDQIAHGEVNSVGRPESAVILNRGASCAPKRFGGGATVKDLAPAMAATEIRSTQQHDSHVPRRLRASE